MSGVIEISYIPIWGDVWEHGCVYSSKPTDLSTSELCPVLYVHYISMEKIGKGSYVQWRAQQGGQAYRQKSVHVSYY